jgi:hypothetical protein
VFPSLQRRCHHAFNKPCTVITDVQRSRERLRQKCGYEQRIEKAAAKGSGEPMDPQPSLSPLIIMVHRHHGLVSQTCARLETPIIAPARPAHHELPKCRLAAGRGNESALGARSLASSIKNEEVGALKLALSYPGRPRLHPLCQRADTAVCPHRPEAIARHQR